MRTTAAASTLLLAGFAALLPRDAVAADAPKRLPRAGSFLGVHFDFHAGKDCTEVGKNTTPAMIENIIRLVKPDYLQIDCKGHPGLSSYPTKVGNRAPGIVGDPLKTWREVTAAHGVALYMHYSGVWDSAAVAAHPEWAAVNADGKPNGKATSFFGPYADKLLIPQLRELAGEYGVDGAWVDGECWASVPDWSEAALKAFREATGIADVPRKPGDPHWHEFLQFHREAFRRYLRRYVEEVKKTHPAFQVCSNWAYTDHMAEPVAGSPVDFLSGDYSPEDSVNSARLSARYLAWQGKPWDLMAWSFARKGGKGPSIQKSVPQLQREAAVVVALGGGFQAYFKQKRDGSVFDEQIPLMGETAAFCRARQALCHRATPVPQVALLLSTAGHYRRINGLFNRDLNRVHGSLQALLEDRHCVDVVGEHHLAGRMADWPIIVVPEWDHLEPAFRDELIAYAKGGGRLLLVGPRTAALFGDATGATAEGPSVKEPRHLAQGDAFVAFKGECQPVKPGPQAKPLGRLHAAADAASASTPAATVAPLGKGRVAAVWFDFAQGYLGNRSAASRRFLTDVVREVFPAPLVEVTGAGDVDVSVARLGGRLLVHLVNTGGPHADRQNPIHDAIPPAGPLTATIRQATKPARVTLEPGGQILEAMHENGRIRVTVPRVEIHGVIVVE
jgi:hypothetical protein